MNELHTYYTSIKNKRKGKSTFVEDGAAANACGGSTARAEGWDQLATGLGCQAKGFALYAVSPGPS